MEKWQSKIVDMGTHPPGTKLKFIFHYLGDINDIKNFKPGCGCTGVTMHNQNTLIATYTTEALTESQISAGLNEAQKVKHVYVNYVDGSQDILKMKVVVTR